MNYCEFRDGRSTPECGKPAAVRLWVPNRALEYGELVDPDSKRHLWACNEHYEWWMNAVKGSDKEAYESNGGMYASRN